MGTTNYDFTYLVGTNTIDLVGDTTTFLDEIDAQIKYVADNAIVQDGGVTTQKLADGAVTTVKIADANVTTAKIADSNVTSNKIDDGAILTAKIADSAVTTGKIADSAVTANKLGDASVTNLKLAAASITTDRLTTQTLKDILGGFTIHHFDSKDGAADNTGLSVPAGGSNWLAGYYVEELKLLIIYGFQKDESNTNTVSWVAGNTGYVLPSYVPRVTATTEWPYGRQLSAGGCVAWDSNTDWEAWGGFGMSTDGSVGPNTSKSGYHQYLFGNVIAFLGCLGAQ